MTTANETRLRCMVSPGMFDHELGVQGQQFDGTEYSLFAPKQAVDHGGLPLARGKALELAAVRSVAAAIGRSPAEVVLRWIMQRGVKLVVMSTQRDRARVNLQARDFTLDDAQMAAIGSGISANMRVVNPAQWAPQWD